MRNKISAWLINNQFLILVLCAIVLLRIPSWFEPYWYGDEAIYLTIGQAISRGVELYGQIHDNKPPFLYLVAALSGGNQFWFKFIATVSTIFTVVVFAKLVEKVTTKRWLRMLGTALFAYFTTWPKIEGNIANAELFFILFTVSTVNILWKKETKVISVLWAGIVLGLGGLFKIPAVLEAAIWPVTWLAFNEREWFKKTLVLGIGVLIPLAASLLYFNIAGTGAEYISAAWAQNIPYLSSWKTSSDGEGIFTLKGRAIVLVFLLAIVYGLAKKWGKNSTIVAAWVLISLFGALLSGRPYPHYMIQIIAPTVLSLIMVLGDKRPAKLINSVVLSCVVISISLFHFYNYPVVGYYRNFLDWAFGHKSSLEYVGWFGSETKRNYEVSAWVKTLSVADKPIFVWGDQPMVYALTVRPVVGKYTVKYHIKDFHAEEDTMMKLQTEMPQIVVDYGFENELPGFGDWLTTNYEVEKIVDGIRIYSKRGRI
jgi:hypothetical protein